MSMRIALLVVGLSFVAACSGGSHLQANKNAPTLRPGGEAVTSIDGRKVSLRDLGDRRGIMLVLLRGFF